jgi:hypothetical protein
MFATIVWASNGSKRADRELSWVAGLATSEQAMLWVVYVARAAAARLEETIVAKLKGQVQELRHDGLAASLYVVRGARDAPVVVAMEAAARLTHADLLIVGAHAAQPAPGDPFPEILSAASCPVLFLPAVLNATRAPAEAHP